LIKQFQVQAGAFLKHGRMLAEVSIWYYHAHSLQLFPS
jgi:hypothetical protein